MFEGISHPLRDERLRSMTACDRSVRPSSPLRGPGRRVGGLANGLPSCLLG